MENKKLKDLILELVKKENGRPIQKNLLYKKLTKKQFVNKSAFFNALDGLVLENTLKVILQNKVILGYINGPLIQGSEFEGIIFLNSKGDGFVKKLDSEISEVYINKKNTLNALNGDKVICCLMDKQKKTNFNKSTSLLKDGVILKVIERNKDFFTGTFNKTKEGYVVKVDDEKFGLTVELDSINGLVNGHKILFKIANIKDNTAYASVSKIIGHENDVGTDILSIVYDAGIEPEFSDEVIEYSSKLDYDFNPQEVSNRVDLTHLDIITIDPKTSKDLDDAIYVEKRGDNFKLYVAIADVSYYVKIGSPVDIEANKRSTSIYLVNKVIPMLPHNLSNDICSLNENEKRMAMTCEMDIDSKGNFLDIKVYPAIIMSKKRFAYEDVNEYFKTFQSNTIKENLQAMLKNAYSLFKILKTKRENNGYIEFDIPEPKIILDENEKIIDIQKKESGKSQNMIECFMVAANEAVTIKFNDSLKDSKFVYRVHDRPDEKKIEAFKIEADKLNFKFDSDINNLKPNTISRWLKQNASNPNKELINMILLRTMAKAEYDTNNIGHFGLALNNYTHFTSPIRRYPDLIVHRLYRMFLLEKDKYSDKQRSELLDNLKEICEHSTKCEIVATNVERDVNSMKFAEYMQSKIGETYIGMVSYITSFGIFIRLDNTIEGCAKQENIKGDFYEFYQDRLIYKGKNTNKILSLGTKVEIKVIGANKTNRKIDFEITKIF